MFLVFLCLLALFFVLRFYLSYHHIHTSVVHILSFSIAFASLLTLVHFSHFLTLHLHLFLICFMDLYFPAHTLLTTFLSLSCTFCTFILLLFCSPTYLSHISLLSTPSPRSLSLFRFQLKISYALSRVGEDELVTSKLHKAIGNHLGVFHNEGWRYEPLRCGV